jgi:hypothetical protein
MGRSGRPWVEPAGTSSPTYLQTKVKAFNATADHFLPTWLHHRQHGSSTSVKSRFLPPIPGWAVKTCHYTHHAGYCSAIDAPSRHKTTTVTSRISRARPYPVPVDPLRYASTWPWLIAGQQEDNACTSARHRTQGLSPSHPWRHHGTPGMASHSWSTSLQQPSRAHVGPSPLRHRPRVLPTPLPSLDLIKGEAGDPPRGERRTKDENRKTPPHYWDQHPK